MDTDDLAVLLAVIDKGSFSALAKARGTAVSTITRRIDALEATLQLRLIDRRRDGVIATADGTRVAAVARLVVETAQRLDRTASALRSGNREEVALSGTEFVVSDILAPRLNMLMAAHPNIRIDLRCQAAVVSLAARDADLAIRMSPPEGASLLVKKLSPFNLGLFASAAYIGDRDPLTIDPTTERLLIIDEGFGRIPELDWVAMAGLTSAVVGRSNSIRTLLAATHGGAGIALLPTLFAKRDGLVEIPTPIAIPQRVSYLVTHRDQRQRPEIRAVHDWVVACFKAIGRP